MDAFESFDKLSLLEQVFLKDSLWKELSDDEAEMRRTRSLVGLHHNRRNQEDGWNNVPPSPDSLTSRSKYVSSDVERSNSSLNIVADAQSSSDLSPSLGRSNKIWKLFKKKTKRIRSFSRDRIDRARSSADRCSDNWESSPTSLGTAEHLRFVENKEVKNGDGEERRSGLDGKSVDSQEIVDDDSVTQKVKAVESRLSMLRSLPFFALNVVLKEGKDLAVRDISGTSDPYVKFSVAGKQYYKSRTVFKNLCPKWDERFVLPIEDPFQPVYVHVFDYDRGLNDDPMGMATIHPAQLDLNRPTDFKLLLTERCTKKKKIPEYLGYLTVNCTLVPKSQIDKEHYTDHMLKFVEQNKRHKTLGWNSIVTILLISGTDLLSMDDNGFSDPYVKFRLGNERYRSKYKSKTLSPKWLEQFNLFMYDNQTSCLEIMVRDHDIGSRDDLMGRATLDLSSLERDKTHSLNVELVDGAGSVHLLVTISALTSFRFNGFASEELTDSPNIAKNYGLLKSFRNLKDVGLLRVKVLKARGLLAADIGGKSDPFCVLELVNSRVQTHTEYKTLSPCWGKVFTFDVKDIHTVLEVLVYDEDLDKKTDFLGKVSIPLLKIHNGRKRWYQLKDLKLTTRMKGAIKLEMSLVFNHVKAAIRTFNPRETKYLVPEPRFRVSVMKNNIDRVSNIVRTAIETGKFVHSCFDWENKARSIIAFIIFLIAVLKFELYMIPLTLLIIFFKNLLVVQVNESILKDKSQDNYVKIEDEEIEEAKESREEKKSFKEKLQAIQDACLQVQEITDKIASMGERVKNSLDWTVPWLSWLAVIVLLIVSVVLYFVPLRYLILLWGINKFTKKLRAPDSIPNNELLDYLSRVPSDKELLLYREFRPDQISIVRKKKQK